MESEFFFFCQIRSTFWRSFTFTEKRSHKMEEQKTGLPEENEEIKTESLTENQQELFGKRH